MSIERLLQFGWCAYRWGFWFRIRGYGLAVRRDSPVLFSERYGHRRVHRMGRWSFEWLYPYPKEAA